MSLPNRGPMRTGLIGFGFAGRTFHAPLLRTTPDLQLCAVASRQPEAVHAALGTGVQVHDTPEALIHRPDLDLVVIASPNDSHHPLAHAALLAGKAVVVDKPFTLDAAQALELVLLAEQRALLLSVFHNRRWDGDFLTLQALLADGRLGRIVQLESHFDRYRPVVRPRWREAAGPGGGLWTDLGPHLLDQALQLFGPPVALRADLATLREGGQADDWFDVQLRHANGLRVQLRASALAAQVGPRFVVQGQRGGWRKWGLDAQEDALRAGAQPDPAHPDAWGHDPSDGELRLAPAGQAGDALLPPQPWPNHRGRYPDYYRDIVRAWRGQGPNPVPPRQALAVMQGLDLARQSAARRCELPWPDGG
jgi:predicted dehydrogenase